MLAVRVFLLNDAGDEIQIIAEDETVDAAIAAAELIAAHRYNDESFIMNDWMAA